MTGTSSGKRSQIMQVDWFVEKNHTQQWLKTQQEKVPWTWQFYHHKTLTWKSLRTVVMTQVICLRYSLISLLCQTTFTLSRANMMTYWLRLGKQISWMPSYWHLRITSFLMTQWVWYLVMGVLNLWFWYTKILLAAEFCLLMSLSAEIPSTYAACKFLFFTLHNWMMPSALVFR